VRQEQGHGSVRLVADAARRRRAPRPGPTPRPGRQLPRAHHGVEAQQERLDELSTPTRKTRAPRAGRTPRIEPLPGAARSGDDTPPRDGRRDAEPGQRRAVVAARADQPLERPAPERRWPPVCGRLKRVRRRPTAGACRDPRPPAGVAAPRLARGVGCAGADRGHATHRLPDGRKNLGNLGITRGAGRTYGGAAGGGQPLLPRGHAGPSALPVGPAGGSRWAGTGGLLHAGDLGPDRRDQAADRDPRTAPCTRQAAGGRTRA